MIPFATGLRSPNGINFSPDGDLFYADNQGEWVATNKLHHLKKGEYYGHPAGLRWVKQSPFAGTLKERKDYISRHVVRRPEGRASRSRSVSRPRRRPCVWFPYTRMGQSISEPIWDTTGGKFGPFAGQMFVGDQHSRTSCGSIWRRSTASTRAPASPSAAASSRGVNRLDIRPRRQPHRRHDQSRLGFHRRQTLRPATARLQRQCCRSRSTPCKLTKDGFDLTFTKPLDDKTADEPEGLQPSIVHIQLLGHLWLARGGPQGGEDPEHERWRRTRKRSLSKSRASAAAVSMN